MQIPFLVFKTSEENKFLGLYKNFFQKFDFEKKNFKKNFRKFFKIQFLQKKYSILYFLIANLILECFQLSFDIHIAYVGKKWQILKFFILKSSKFSKSN